MYRVRRYRLLDFLFGLCLLYTVYALCLAFVQMDEITHEAFSFLGWTVQLSAFPHRRDDPVLVAIFIVLHWMQSWQWWLH